MTEARAELLKGAGPSLTDPSRAGGSGMKQPQHHQHLKGYKREGSALEQLTMAFITLFSPRGHREAVEVQEEAFGAARWPLRAARSRK